MSMENLWMNLMSHGLQMKWKSRREVIIPCLVGSVLLIALIFVAGHRFKKWVVIKSEASELLGEASQAMYSSSGINTGEPSQVSHDCSALGVYSSSGVDAREPGQVSQDSRALSVTGTDTTEVSLVQD